MPEKHDTEEPVLNYEFTARLFDDSRMTLPKDVRKKAKADRGTRMLFKLIRVISRDNIPRRRSRKDKEREPDRVSEKMEGTTP